MLCVRDVTELRELAAEAGEQKRRLEMIGEILAVSEEKFHHFVESSTSFIHENEHIIRQHDCADTSAIAALFRNMHTIKGNARTYSLQHLTGVVHEVEQRYDALRREDTSHAWDQQALIADLERVKTALEHYSSINEVSLGRGPRAAGAQNGAASLTVTREAIEETLRIVDRTDDNDLPALRAMRAELRATLRAIGTERVADALAGVTGSLPSLAQELGKVEPVVRIADNGYRLRSEAAGTVKNVFMHLLRNSLDHGIEMPAQRRAIGKDESGHIDIDVNVHDGALQLTLADDGRGLALARIRGIAVERGWLQAYEAVSDDVIAAFIFRPGFSTATSVTEVSGRGVGMDAVRDFLEREGGAIELRFTDDRAGADYRHFQTVVRLPQQWAVKMADATQAKQEEALGG
ncbi:ATP-binding protein, partial [Paraburkholderia sp. BR14262]|uniref:ATP-binding protein n=1 Tax=Paraburkholderia sp. BR14262 TaxID=3236999 RepID=UPI0034CF11C5